MYGFYVRTHDLIELLKSFEKQNLSVLSLDVLEADKDEEYGGPASLWISGVDPSDPDCTVEDSIDSDESLADLF